MDFLTSKRFVTTALILLATLNIVLLGVIWWQNVAAPCYPSPPQRGQFNRSVMMNPQLALTDTQKERFAFLRREHFRQTAPVLQQIVALKRELVTEALKNNVDTTKTAAISDKIGALQSKLERSLAIHFHELSNTCTPAQRDTLQNLLNHLHNRRYNAGNDRQGPPGSGARHMMQGRGINMPPPLP